MATNLSRIQTRRGRRWANRLPAVDRVAVSLATGISSWQLALVLSLLLGALVVNQLTTVLARYSFARGYILRTASIAFAIAVASLAVVFIYQVSISIVRSLLTSFGRKRIVSTSQSGAHNLLARVSRISTRALFVAAVAGAAGGVGNILLTMYGSYAYDQRLLDARSAYDASKGCFAFSAPNRSISSLIYCRKADDSFEVRLPFAGEVPPQTREAFESLEDRGLGERLSSFNLRGIGRAFCDTVTNQVFGSRRSTLQGASGIPEQLAASLLSLKPRGERTLTGALTVKLEKFIGGLRVSDLFKDEMLRMYADETTYGTVSGYEIRGYAAASLLFYGRSPSDLTKAESFELAGRVQNPRIRFPFRIGRETESAFTQRLKNEKTRLSATLDNAINQGQFEKDTADAILTDLFTSLRPLDQIRDDLKIPHRDLFLKEAGKRIPDSASRFINVEISANESALQALEESVSQARILVSKQLKGSELEDLAIDAVVLDGNGDELAQVGQARTRGDGCSIFKPWLYEQALERGLLRSIDADVMPGLPARKALAFSVNDAALKLIQDIGPSDFKTRLEANGFSVVCSCSPIALGAGVDSSPLEVAAAYRQFGFSDVGFRVVETGFIRQIRDGKTGEVLFARTRVGIGRVDTAVAVRSALQDVSLYGTAKQLRFLSLVAPIASKTGTSAFFRDGRWQGNGGSWVIANDSRTGVTVVVRMRFRGNRPFRPEGGSSAVFVVRNFISRWRERNSR